MIFFYMLCSLAIKPNLQRILGVAPAMSAQNADPFGMTKAIIGDQGK